jgi:hypothetical protein
MPAPFDYTVQRPDIMGAIGAYEAGRDRNRQMMQQNRQDMFAQYLPGALKGDQQALQGAQQNATPEQQMQLQNALAQMEDRQLQQTLQQQEKFARLAQWADTPQKWAQATQMAEAEGLQGAAQIPFEQRGAKLAGMLSVKDQLDQEWKRREFALQERNVNSQIGSRNAMATARTAGAAGRPMGRPMSSGVQSKEDEDIADVQSIQSVNTQIDQILGDLESGSLELGPINNLVSRGQNLAGLSTPGSRNFAILEATLEKLRNDSLRLNKGVQTEGDAIRAWNEITKYVTDPKVVAEQLTRVRELNGIAERQRLQRINVRRSRNGYDAFNPAEIGLGGGMQVQPPAPAPAAAGGQGIEPGTIEDGYVFRGGDPADPNNWVEMQ